jgi:hypothetical protein
MPGVFRISEVASIDEEFTMLAKALMKDVMVAVLERVVDVLGEINDALRMAFHKALKGLNTLAGHIFLGPWFVIGTMPFADQFNGCGILVVHFRRAVWEKSIILPLRKDRPCFQKPNSYKKRTRPATASLVLFGILKLAGTLTFTKPFSGLLYLANLHGHSLLS